MIIHVDLDAFFASVEQRDNPKLKNKPVIVGGSAFATRGVVSTASYEARKYGIHSGMPLFRARMLCPQAVFIPVNFAKYEQVSQRFFSICASYSPLIEQASLDELYIDLSDTQLLWPGSLWVARQIQSRVQKEIGITCSIGISAQKTLSKIASGIHKPNGITFVKPGVEKQFLAPLKIGDIPGCGKQTQKLLQAIKVKTIGDLAQIYPDHIMLLVGKNGLHLWNIANGKDDTAVKIPDKTKSSSRSITFSFDTNNVSFVEAMLFYLCQKVAFDLRTMRVGGSCISITVRTSEFETHSIQCTSKEPINTAFILFTFARQLIWKLWNGITLIRLIGVGISNFHSIESQSTTSNQLKLGFHLNEINKQGIKWFRLESSLDALRKKYGFLSITPAVLLNSRVSYLK